MKVSTKGQRREPSYHTPIDQEPRLAWEMPHQPGDEKLVNSDNPSGPQWGELFGRPRIRPGVSLPYGFEVE